MQLELLERPPELTRAQARRNAMRAANAARATGKGWGKGEIAHLVKPLLAKDAKA